MSQALSLPSFDKQFFQGKKIAIYVPTYNCQNYTVSVLERMPPLPDAAVLVLDNASTDNTVVNVTQAIESGKLPLPTVLVRNPENRGYAGSQKTAYSLLRDLPSLEWIMMVHGDGQYEPALISRLEPYLKGDADLVYGVRSKSEAQEETPFHTYFIIKTLSFIESLITGHFRKEWHSGFVMYRTRFLRQVELSALTTTPHIDGHLLFVAGLLKANVQSVNIYKRYKELTAFEGAERIRYVFNVFRLMWNFRKTKKDDIVRRI